MLQHCKDVIFYELKLTLIPPSIIRAPTAILLDDYTACTEETITGNEAPTIDLAGLGQVNIASPNWPNIYYDSSDCHWDFMTSTPGKVIQITNVYWEVSNIFLP